MIERETTQGVANPGAGLSAGVFIESESEHAPLTVVTSVTVDVRAIRLRHIIGHNGTGDDFTLQAHADREALLHEVDRLTLAGEIYRTYIMLALDELEAGKMHDAQAWLDKAMEGPD